MAGASGWCKLGLRVDWGVRIPDSVMMCMVKVPSPLDKSYQ